MDTVVPLVGGDCAVGVLGLCYSALVIIAFSPKRRLNAKPHPQTPTAQPPAIMITEINGERVVG